jgi:hypothetical protein
MTTPLKAYIINFVAPSVNLGAVNQYLFDSVDIAAYWNYLPLVYCVKTRLSATELTQKLKPFFPSLFMVAEVNIFNMDGQLPPDAWDWFYLDHHDKIIPPPKQTTDWLAELMLLPPPTTKT